MAPVNSRGTALMCGVPGSQQAILPTAHCSIRSTEVPLTRGKTEAANETLEDDKNWVRSLRGDFSTRTPRSLAKGCIGPDAVAFMH